MLHLRGIGGLSVCLARSLRHGRIHATSPLLSAAGRRISCAWRPIWLESIPTMNTVSTSACRTSRCSEETVASAPWSRPCAVNVEKVARNRQLRRSGLVRQPAGTQRPGVLLRRGTGRKVDDQSRRWRGPEIRQIGVRTRDHARHCTPLAHLQGHASRPL